MLVNGDPFFAVNKVEILIYLTIVGLGWVSCTEKMVVNIVFFSFLY